MILIIAISNASGLVYETNLDLHSNKSKLNNK